MCMVFVRIIKCKSHLVGGVLVSVNVDARALPDLSVRKP